MHKFPDKNELRILFSHSAYQMSHCFSLRNTGINHSQTWSVEDTKTQSIGAGYDQFPLDRLKSQNITLTNATGVNADAVSQHAMGLILALYRQIHSSRDNQRAKIWRSMISDISKREDDLCGDTVLIVGLGAIGNRLASLCKAFGMSVIGIKRKISDYSGPADKVIGPDKFIEVLPNANVVVLCCPLNEETRELMNEETFSAMKESAYFINVARGGCVDESALLSALTEDLIGGAAIDHFIDEPLPDSSPFWELSNLIITPHTGGETRKYEENVIDILWENLERLWDNESMLLNQIV